MCENSIINATEFKLVLLDSQLVPLYEDADDRNNMQSAELAPYEIQADELIPLIARHFLDTSYIVAYMYSKVIIGKGEEGTFRFCDPEDFKEVPISERRTFDPAQVLKLRAFNHAQELLIWKSGNILKARLRKDKILRKGGNCYAVAADQVLAGTRIIHRENGWISVREDRGGSLALPFPNALVDLNETPNKRIHIRTYNYIGETPAYQATYVDCRFVEFTGV